MGRNSLKIFSPIIKEIGNKTALVAVVDDQGSEKELSYIVDKKYGKYLTHERSDAFVTVLLYYAMVNGLDIEWETPCDEQLIYQLRTYFIPVYSSELPFMKSINLSGPVTKDQIETVGGVATGLSNGVDSLYTVEKYLTDIDEKYKLTHVFFTDWFTTAYSREIQDEYLNFYLLNLPKCAEELGLDFVYVQFYPDIDFSVGNIRDKERGTVTDHGLFTLKYCSMAMVLRKLIGVYYFSSGVSPSDFSFKKDDMAYHDLFTLQNVCTANLWFYSTGMEVSRLEKIDYIANWGFAQKYLQVCAWDNDVNCGHCSKCIRTMSELDSIGKLDLFAKRFPVDDFRKNYAKRMGRVLMEARKGHCFEVEVIDRMKIDKRNIPYRSYLYSYIYQLIESIRVRLRGKKWARRIYRKFHLDKKLYGRSTSKYVQSLDKELLGIKEQEK